jgi:hypothetical protein
MRVKVCGLTPDTVAAAAAKSNAVKVWSGADSTVGIEAPRQLRVFFNAT